MFGRVGWSPDHVKPECAQSVDPAADLGQDGQFEVIAGEAQRTTPDSS
jgi:hypothetical protein